MSEPAVSEPSFAAALVERLARLAHVELGARDRLALAQTVGAVDDGHVGLSPEALARRMGAGRAEVEATHQALVASGLVERATLASSPETVRHPFVLDPSGRLYLTRLFDAQQRVRASLVARATRPPTAMPAASALAQLFPPSAHDPAQRAAAERAATAAFTVISGGPGTGKTSTVARVLALLVGTARAAGAPPPRIALLAPTGKAAARLAESITHARDRLEVDPDVRAAIPAKASTVHRALEAVPGVGFRRTRARPLDADVVVVDEASMLGLGLFDALLDAIPPEARLVLLGDQDQLASVEAGSVLADIGAGAAQDGSPLSGAVCVLETSHRFGATSGIARAARAVRHGDADTLLALLRDPAVADVELGPEVTADRNLPADLVRAARDGFASPQRADESLSAYLTRFRILTALRRGPVGAPRINQRIAAALGRTAEPSVPGSPLLVVENDAETALSNGDLGFTDAGPSGSLARFATDRGERAFALARLPRHELAYAMSVHKSQGSEYDEVAVLLPHDSRVSTRELLYTALTRARGRVVVYASEASLRAAVARRVDRTSGLHEALALPAGPAGEIG